METIIQRPGIQHAQIVYRAAEGHEAPGFYEVRGYHLWKHRNGYWYVLCGPRLKRRISSRAKDFETAKEFLSRFFRTHRGEL